VWERRTVVGTFRSRTVEVLAPFICFNLSLLKHRPYHRVIRFRRQLRVKHVAPPVVSLSCTEVEGQSGGSDGTRVGCRVGDDTLKVCFTASGPAGDPVTVVSFSDDGAHGAYFIAGDACLYVPPMLHHTTADTVTVKVADGKDPTRTASASLFIDREWVN